VGDRPRSQIVFDGTYIWLTNSGDGTVSKLRASDGTLVDTLKVGEGPRAIAFDGSTVWVGNTDSDNVTRLDAK
jgi:DNA-binding beta-propeller fold protein YncE